MAPITPESDQVKNLIAKAHIMRAQVYDGRHTNWHWEMGFDTWDILRWHAGPAAPTPLVAGAVTAPRELFGRTVVRRPDLPTWSLRLVITDATS